MGAWNRGVMEAEPFTVELTAGTLDADGGGHVSNVVFPNYLETARREYLRETLGDRFGDRGFVIVNLDLDYLDEIYPGDELTITVETAAVGTTSFTLAYRVLSGGSVIAEATTVQVVRSREEREPVPVPDAWRDRLHPGARA